MALIIEENIHLHADDFICTDGSTSSGYDELFSFDKSIYRILSNQNDMKFLEYPDRIRNEFDLFLQYSEAHHNGEVNEGFVRVNNYLGSLGVTNGIC